MEDVLIGVIGVITTLSDETVGETVGETGGETTGAGVVAAAKLDGGGGECSGRFGAAPQGEYESASGRVQTDSVCPERTGTGAFPPEPGTAATSAAGTAMSTVEPVEFVCSEGITGEKAVSVAETIGCSVAETPGMSRKLRAGMKTASDSSLSESSRMIPIPHKSNTPPKTAMR